MTSRALAAAMAATLLVASATPTMADDKRLTPQQQKMKDCTVQWKIKKQAESVSGRVAYSDYMRSCLRG